MDASRKFITTSLSHEAPRYYDPVKAREYYLRTRELKDRQSGAGLVETPKQTLTKKLNKKQRAALAEKTSREQAALVKRQNFAYSKNQVTEAKKAESEKFKQLNADEMKKAQEKASKLRVEISDKLSNIMANLSGDRTASLKALTEKAQSQIDALPPIPKGVSKEKAAELSAKRREDIAKIRGDVSKERASISDDTAKKRDNNKETAAVDREVVGTQLKETVDTARQNYEKLKQELTAKYEAEYQSEYDAIKKMR